MKGKEIIEAHTTDKKRYQIVEVFPSGYRKRWPYRMTSNRALDVAIKFTYISPQNNFVIEKIND